MTSSIRFAHLADLHLGGWREKRLTDLNFKTFELAIQKVIEAKVDFCLFAGDIFNNAIPSIELVQKVVAELIKLKENKIPLYVIGGSHDYSISGKSFIQLLDTAGVFCDVCKFKYVDKNRVQLIFTKDKNTQTNISGILGKKNGLDKNIYSNLDSNTLSKENFNVFMFHATLNDFKPDFMKAVKTQVSSNWLPKGFDYYAGGHVHTHMQGIYDKGIITYPGPLFANNFSEMKREKPSFNLCEFDFKTRETKIKRVFLDTYEKEYVKVEINNLSPIDARQKIESEIDKVDFKGKILLIEINGVVEGKISDVRMSEIINSCYSKGAFHVLKNTYKLTSSSLEIAKVNISDDMKNIEDEIIKDVLKDNDKSTELFFVVKSLLSLDLGKIEGEKVAQYEQRVGEALEKSLNNTKY